MVDYCMCMRYLDSWKCQGGPSIGLYLPSKIKGHFDIRLSMSLIFCSVDGFLTAARREGIGMTLANRWWKLTVGCCWAKVTFIHGEQSKAPYYSAFAMNWSFKYLDNFTKLERVKILVDNLKCPECVFTYIPLTNGYHFSNAFRVNDIWSSSFQTLSEFFIISVDSWYGWISSFCGNIDLYFVSSSKGTYSS